MSVFFPSFLGAGPADSIGSHGDIQARQHTYVGLQLTSDWRWHAPGNHAEQTLLHSPESANCPLAMA